MTRLMPSHVFFLRRMRRGDVLFRLADSPLMNAILYNVRDAGIRNYKINIISKMLSFFVSGLMTLPPLESSQPPECPMHVGGV
jgi:hypothetical protein